MAATRTKIPVGSAPWFVQERRQADELVAMETEEFGYSVRNEMEWLNEHMGEIFSRNNLNVADIFKTPGKLRGKTPRTARKRNVLGERAPLTDIFAPNVQSSTTSPAKNNFYNKVAQIQIQQDENQIENRPQPVPEPVKQAPTRSKQNWDSGYHGITDDEMEAELVQSQASTFAKDVVEDVIVEQPTAPSVSEERRTTNETFVSAREDASRQGSKTFAQEDASSTVPDEETPQMPAEEPQAEPVVEIIPPTQQEENADEMEVDEAQSPSPAPSPEKPLVRKSSFTFSSLPSREPLAQKKSIGARSSVLQQARSSVFGRFTGGKSLGGQQQINNGDEDEDMMDADAPSRPMLGREESQTTRNHNHSTTEELRNRINMLGQARDMRTSKSIPNLNASTNKPAYPQMGQAQLDKSEGETARPVTAPAPKQVMPGTLAEDDEDDWIAPVAPTASRPDLTRTQTTESVDKTVLFTSDALAAPTSPARKNSPGRPKLPFGHKKAVSEVITSPSRAAMAPSHQKAISVSNPSVPTPTGNESTTPVGSPRRGHLDGAVSATKAKLYSAFRSAKGIFASSAGVSAQAKMEQLSPGPKARPPTVEEGYFAGAEIQYPNLPQSRIASAETGTTTASQEGRRTRSSTEKDQKRKDQEAKQMQKMETELEKIREKERQKAAAHASKLQKSPSKDTLASARSGAPSRTESERPRTAEEHDSADDMPPPPPPKSMLPGPGQAQRLREPRRIAKPTKEAAPKAKPAPVTIRMHVPSQLGHRPAPGPSTAALSQSLQDSLPPPPPPKPTLTSKASTTSLHSSQSQGTLRGGNPSAAAKKALDAAAKKKEADAKAAQRKAERQREIEQRRQAKQDEERRKQEEERRRQDEEKRRVEEERRAEQRRRQAEMQRREEAKRQAERQAAEQRRLDQERLEQQRLEQQRVQQEKMDQQRREQQQRAQADGFAYAYKQEKAQAASNHPRADMGGARPISRMMHHDGRPPVMVNPAKPKRALAEEDDHNQRPPMQRNPASYQQHDAKRRKTIEDEENEPMDQRRSVMAGPPVRQSNMNKAPAKFPHGYNAAPQPGQHAQSMYMKTINHQHQLMQQKSEMSQFASGHIPGMSAPSKASAANPHKTPLRQMPGHHLNTKSAAKSSPHYPDPEKIALPEIATDSEDEDSDNEFQAPSWTESPALRELLTNQQLVDPMQVFGPIAPLRMEEVFRNKERQKKFRDRTSSANWAGADRLTEEERRKDQEGRERMMKEGGWTFGLGQ